MKQVVCWILCCWMVVLASAQNGSLFISTDKTSSLIFPFPVKHVDRGSKAVLVEQVAEAENILLVKAGVVNFPETNLSVITGDGSLYSFVVSFSAKPAVWVYQLPVQIIASVASYANNLLDNPPTVKGISDHKWDMKAKTSGIYIKDDVIFFQIEIENNSSINYDIDFIRFFIRDQKKLKRTAIQETELIPLTIAGNIKKVKAASASVIVIALPKFTIQDAKYLAIQIGEKDGGRHLDMKMGNRKIIKAILLPDYR